MTQLHGPRSGDLVRARRRHHFQQDLQHADCILIQGSAMAEAHPVGFRWVMKAKERGAHVIHVDPRFSRTSALADRHVAIRAGSDIAFLGGLIRHVIESESYFREYVVNYTNAPTIVNERYRDTEDLGGVFSGFDPETGMYDRTHVDVRGRRDAPPPPACASTRRRRSRSTTGAGMLVGDVPRDDDPPAPALRVPDPAPPLPPLHARDGRAHLRHLAGGLPRRGRRR